MATTTSELAVKTPNEFALFNATDGAKALQELIQENLGDETFRPNELDRITVPSGGGTSLEIPTVEGTEEIKELECIVLLSKPLRLYWSTEFTGEGTPPDCMSTDGINGFGDPGGLCSVCPLAKYDQEVGKSECNEKRNLFILPANALLPFVLSVPFMSIKPMKQYLQKLMRAGKSINKITTVISLEKTKNNKGINYSELRFRPGNDLDAEQIEMVKGYKESFKTVIEATHQATAESGGGPAFDVDAEE